MPIRLTTALILAAVVIGVLASGSAHFWAALVTVFCLAAAWEGAQLAARPAIVLQLALTVGAIAFVAYSLHNAADSAMILTMFLVVVTVFWVVIAPLQLAKRSIDISSVSGRVIFAVLIAAAWLSAVALYKLSAWYLVAVVVLTVVADVAAYFFGRKFGRVKLAPAISPGKSREGAIAGIVAAALWSLGAAYYLNLSQDISILIVIALFGGAIGAMAVIGDLWESQLKRQAGAKDSSKLLPGHGGVLDRIDAQLAVLPIATLLLSFVVPLWK
ncbi:MAG: phosphatidate cytidylyltransferase [Casimicrobium sp.]